MTLRDLLKKKDKVADSSDVIKDSTSTATTESDAPQFTFLRTTTHTQEQIEPPSFADERKLNPSKDKKSLRPSRYRKHSASSASTSSIRSDVLPNDTSPRDPHNFDPPQTKKHERKLSERLHLHSRSRSASSQSSIVPSELPSIENDAVDIKDEDGQAQWEARATILAKSNPLDGRGRAETLDGASNGAAKHGISGDVQSGGRSRSRSVGDEKGDANIQRAIELHEAGDLEKSTKIFGILADPNGANNALSQVLYGLALR
jgi:hypothetical protein